MFFFAEDHANDYKRILKMKEALGLPGDSFLLQSDDYYIEPGVNECREYLTCSSRKGGIGSEEITVAYHDFFLAMPKDKGRDPYPGSVHDFLDSVFESVRKVSPVHYYTLSLSKVEDYLRHYLELYIPDKPDQNQILYAIADYTLHNRPQDIRYLDNITIGSSYFNNIFYVTSWMAAKALFPFNTLNSICTTLDRIPHRLSTEKFFVNKFDGVMAHHFELIDFDGWAAFLDGTETQSNWRCSEKEYREGLLPYILFLSTWTLILATYLCVDAFGQCAITYLTHRQMKESLFKSLY